MVKRYFWIINLLLLSASLVLGCQSEQPDVTPPLATETEPTAIPTTISQSPLSTPVSPISQPTQSPTPTAPKLSTGKSVIYGRLLIDDGHQTPLAETALYLTPGIGENGDQLPPLLVGVQEGDVRGFTDAEGGFAIDDIPPGKYYLIIWAPLSWIPLHDVYNGQIDIILLELQADQILDLGEKAINWP